MGVVILGLMIGVPTVAIAIVLAGLLGALWGVSSPSTKVPSP
mgnify:CR=1 FL=1